MCIASGVSSDSFCKPTTTSTRTGFALLDEFSDAISASITDGFEGGIDVVSVSTLPTDAPTN
jgi:hypothetical protein